MWVCWRKPGKLTHPGDPLKIHVGRLLGISKSDKSQVAPKMTIEAAAEFGDDYPADPQKLAIWTVPVFFALQVAWLAHGDVPPWPRLLRRPGFTPQGRHRRQPKIKATTPVYRAL